MELFDTFPKLPPGFVYQPAFLTHKEERDLIESVGQEQFRPFMFQGFEAKREVV